MKVVIYVCPECREVRYFQHWYSSIFGDFGPMCTNCPIIIMPGEAIKL